MGIAGEVVSGECKRDVHDIYTEDSEPRGAVQDLKELPFPLFHCFLAVITVTAGTACRQPNFATVLPTRAGLLSFLPSLLSRLETDALPGTYHRLLCRCSVHR